MKQYILVVALALLFVIFTTKPSFSQKEKTYHLVPLEERESQELTKERDNFLKNLSEVKKGLELESNNLKFQLISGNLSENIKKLEDILSDLLEIQDLCKSIFLGNVIDDLSNIQRIFLYETQFLSNCIMIKKEYELKYYNREIKNLKTEKKIINIYLKQMRQNYALITNNAALRLIDKAKEIIQSSLELFDRSIQILESNINLIK